MWRTKSREPGLSPAMLPSAHTHWAQESDERHEQRGVQREMGRTLRCTRAPNLLAKVWRLRGKQLDEDGHRVGVLHNVRLLRGARSNVGQRPSRFKLRMARGREKMVLRGGKRGRRVCRGSMAAGTGWRTASAATRARQLLRCAPECRAARGCAAAARGEGRSPLCKWPRSAGCGLCKKKCWGAGTGIRTTHGDTGDEACLADDGLFSGAPADTDTHGCTQERPASCSCAPRDSRPRTSMAAAKTTSGSDECSRCRS